MVDKVDSEVREALAGLYDRLNKLERAGYIETGTRALCYQVMSRMARQQSLEIITCWEDMGKCIVRDESGNLLSGAAPSDHFHFLGALQQLQRALGVVSHITWTGMDAAARGCMTDHRFPHFSEELEFDGSLLKPNSLIFFRVVPGCGLLVDETITAYTRQSSVSTTLPGWVME